jgi:hypothetical protein
MRRWKIRTVAIAFWDCLIAVARKIPESTYFFTAERGSKDTPIPSVIPFSKLSGVPYSCVSLLTISHT